MYDQLQEVVQLAAMPLPERPDGIVAIAKFTTASLDDCRTTEAEYERLARSNPSTLFLRCFAEYENADLLFGQAQVTVWPTFDIFYGGTYVCTVDARSLTQECRIYTNMPWVHYYDFLIGNRVARVEGPNHVEVEELLKCYQFQNSQLDLFSEVAPNPWGDGQRAKSDFSKTPRTTARFLPGYDWGSDRGFFDATADKMENDFMGMYETSWIPDPDDDGRKKK